MVVELDANGTDKRKKTNNYVFLIDVILIFIYLAERSHR